jgi:hypothetical protein
MIMRSAHKLHLLRAKYDKRSGGENSLIMKETTTT